MLAWIVPTPNNRRQACSGDEIAHCGTVAATVPTARCPLLTHRDRLAGTELNENAVVQRPLVRDDRDVGVLGGIIEVVEMEGGGQH
jgi:hypothetical protein